MTETLFNRSPRDREKVNHLWWCLCKPMLISSCCFPCREKNILTCNIRACTNFTHSQACHFVSHNGWKQELFFQLCSSKSTAALSSVTSLKAIIEHSLFSTIFSLRYCEQKPYAMVMKNHCITNWYFNRKKIHLQRYCLNNLHQNNTKERLKIEFGESSIGVQVYMWITVPRAQVIIFQEMDLFDVPHLRESTESYLASAGVAISLWTPMAMGMPPQLMLPSSSATATL